MLIFTLLTTLCLCSYSSRQIRSNWHLGIEDEHIRFINTRLAEYNLDSEETDVVYIYAKFLVYLDQSTRKFKLPGDLKDTILDEFRHFQKILSSYTEYLVQLYTVDSQLAIEKTETVLFKFLPSQYHLKLVKCATCFKSTGLTTLGFQSAEDSELISEEARAIEENIQYIWREYIRVADPDQFKENIGRQFGDSVKCITYTREYTLDVDNVDVLLDVKTDFSDLLELPISLPKQVDFLIRDVDILIVQLKNSAMSTGMMKSAKWGVGSEAYSTMVSNLLRRYYLEKDGCLEYSYTVVK